MKRMIGKVFVAIDKGDQHMKFVANDTSVFTFHHDQDCCESVSIHEIVGDLEDLLHTPMLEAEEATNKDTGTSYDSATWTFYKFATVKGRVTISWLGESNGYYSESVDLKVEEADLITYAKMLYKGVVK